MTTPGEAETAKEQTFDIPKECWAGVVKNEGPSEFAYVEETLSDNEN
jgi:hypothetical protein